MLAIDAGDEDDSMRHSYVARLLPVPTRISSGVAVTHRWQALNNAPIPVHNIRLWKKALPRAREAVGTARVRVRA